jgi:hypothetical protein
MEGYSYKNMNVGDRNVITDDKNWKERISEIYVRDGKEEHELLLKEAENNKLADNIERKCPRCEKFLVLAVYSCPKMKEGSLLIMKRACPDSDCGITWYYEYNS